jgi:hypothetical protein
MGADSASSCARIRSTGSGVLAIALYVTAKDWGFVEHSHDAAPLMAKTPISLIHLSPHMPAVISLRIPGHTRTHKTD